MFVGESIHHLSWDNLILYFNAKPERAYIIWHILHLWLVRQSNSFICFFSVLLLFVPLFFNILYKCTVKLFFQKLKESHYTQLTLLFLLRLNTRGVVLTSIKVMKIFRSLLLFEQTYVRSCFLFDECFLWGLIILEAENVKMF